LAAIVIARENVATVEADRLSRQAIVDHQPDDPRHLQFEVDGLNPIFVRFFEVAF